MPKPTDPSANDATAIQKLLGDKFGGMSTLVNCTFQSFNFRERDRLQSFYSLMAAIAAEEYSHIEAVSYAAANRHKRPQQEPGCRPAGRGRRLPQHIPLPF